MYNNIVFAWIFDTRMIVFISDIVFRKHTARKDYEELIKKLHVDQEYALVERGKKGRALLSSTAPDRAFKISF